MKVLTFLLAIAAATVARGEESPAEILTLQAEPISVQITRCWHLTWPGCEQSSPALHHFYVRANQEVDVELSYPPLQNENGLVRQGLEVFPTTGRADPSVGAAFELKIDFDTLESGAYSSYVFASSDAGRIVLPVSVKVRDPIEPTFLVLFFGLAIGLWVTSYVEKQKDADEFRSRIYSLEERVRQNQSIHYVFKEKIFSELQAAEFQIKNRNQKAAETFLQSARDYWNKWRTLDADWRHRMANLDHLISDVRQHIWSNNGLSDLLNELESFRISSVDQTPDELRNQTDQSRKKFQEVRGACELLDRLAEAIDAKLENIDEVRRGHMLSIFQRHIDDLKKIDLSDGKDMKYLRSNIEATIEEVRMVTSDVDTTLDVDTAHTNSIQVSRLSWQYDFGTATPTTRWFQARLLEKSRMMRTMPFWKRWWIRLRYPNRDDPLGMTALYRTSTPRSTRMFTIFRRTAFAVLGYGVLMIILTGTGMNELYINNTTFGGNVWSDYLALFAWGFGAEATRSAFMKLAGSWQLSAVPQTRDQSIAGAQKGEN